MTTGPAVTQQTGDQKVDQEVSIDAHGVTLAGTFTPAGGDRAALLLHGFLSDRRAGGRFDRLAAVYAGLGFAVLRIDLSGFGESGGAVVDGDQLRRDVDAALDWLDARGFTRQVLHGHSLGSALAFRVAPVRPAVQTVVATGALTGAGFGKLPYTPLAGEQLAAWDRDEDVALPLPHPTSARTHALLNRARPKVGEDGTQEEVLRSLPVPVLVVHGDTGDQERALAETTARGQQWLPAGSEVVVIPGADHLFYDHQEEVAALVTDWVGARVPA